MKQLFILAGIICSLGVNAQNPAAKKQQVKIIEHKVAPGENMYSIARKYNVGFNDLVTANKFNKDRSLKTGETIKVPKVLAKEDKKSAAKETAKADTKKAETAKPDPKAKDIKIASAKSAKKAIVHKVEAGDNLYSVARKYKVAVNDLTAANNFGKDRSLKIGEEIRIPVSADVAKNTEPKKEAKSEKITPKKEETKAPVVAKTAKPDPRDKVENKKKNQAVVKESKPAVEEKIAAAPPPAPETINDLDGSGFFKPLYLTQLKKGSKSNGKDVTSGMFKTNKGWAEGKFYILMDGAKQGDVVKVINPKNNLAVYAKVLGGMQGMPESDGFDVRVSDAAIALLDISSSEKFPLKVIY